MSPSKKAELKQLILDALSTQYVSRSCQDEIKTGNRYQSLRLGDEVAPGFRAARDAILDRIRFEGATVLDLGSNLGELSRYARKRGAALVDGIEYDPFFVEIANLVNAYNDVTRVSFRQGDITNPDAYRDLADVVLAFSVWTYVGKMLPQLASVTRKLLVIETHNLSDNLESGYIAPISKFFPAHRILGETDWGQHEHCGEGRRVVLAFARSEALLAQMLRDPAADENDRALRACKTIQAAHPGSTILDLAESRLTVFDGFRRKFPDVSNVELLYRAAREADPFTVSPDETAYRAVYSGWCYWAAFLCGIDEFRNGKPAAETSFAGYMRELFERTRWDPGLERLMAEPARYAERLQRRYVDGLRIQAGDISALRPLSAVLTDNLKAPMHLRVHGADKTVACSRYDGYHRTFSALLAGVRYLPLILQPAD